MKRLLSLVIALLLLATIPVSAFAIRIDIIEELYTDQKASAEGYYGSAGTAGSVTISDKPIKVSIDEFEEFIVIDGKKYKVKGLNDSLSYSPKSQLEIPAPPAEGTPEYDEWFARWGTLYLAYVPHKHESEVWYGDNTHHFQMCDECWDRFNLNLHEDENEDGYCDDCGVEIHYYTITVLEMEGGTVTLSKEKGMLDDRIDVTVTPDDGYVLKGIRFFNLNKQHSQLTCHVDVKGEKYHFIVLPWDIEIEAEFVKAE